MIKSHGNFHLSSSLRLLSCVPYELHPRLAVFLIVGTVRIKVAGGLVSESVVSRVMLVNSSHVKGGGVTRRRQYIRSLERSREICQATPHGNGATGRNSIDHSPQVRTSSNSRFTKPHAMGTRLYRIHKHAHGQISGRQISPDI
ncbi:hypothetical protein AVEN_13471-1 [Araneus ventricosus]|uniref:Uncharacterized protein n=1 Tax=Araneus ventricosus TaxID=182803 RepID=A0A4Y2IVY7_ARAVE|nr:hypothetical protein AVEN_13471-1 [Araneus ventricosus]